MASGTRPSTWLQKARWTGEGGLDYYIRDSKKQIRDRYVENNKHNSESKDAINAQEMLIYLKQQNHLKGKNKGKDNFLNSVLNSINAKMALDIDESLRGDPLFMSQESSGGFKFERELEAVRQSIAEEIQKAGSTAFDKIDWKELAGAGAQSAKMHISYKMDEWTSSFFASDLPQKVKEEYIKAIGKSLDKNLQAKTNKKTQHVTITTTHGKTDIGAYGGKINWNIKANVDTKWISALKFLMVNNISVKSYKSNTPTLGSSNAYKSYYGTDITLGHSANVTNTFYVHAANSYWVNEKRGQDKKGKRPDSNPEEIRSYLYLTRFIFELAGTGFNNTDAVDYFLFNNNSKYDKDSIIIWSVDELIRNLLDRWNAQSARGFIKTETVFGPTEFKLLEKWRKNYASTII